VIDLKIFSLSSPFTSLGNSEMTLNSLLMFAQVGSSKMPLKCCIPRSTNSLKPITLLSSVLAISHMVLILWLWLNYFWNNFVFWYPSSSQVDWIFMHQSNSFSSSNLDRKDSWCLRFFKPSLLYIPWSFSWIRSSKYFSTSTIFASLFLNLPPPRLPTFPSQVLVMKTIAHGPMNQNQERNYAYYPLQWNEIIPLQTNWGYIGRGSLA